MGCEGTIPIVCGQFDRDLIPLDIVVRWVIEVLGDLV